MRELTLILEAHAVWRRDPHHARARRADLCGADLRGANLSRMQLAGAHLRGALLSKALLQETNLQQADLSAADLRQAILGRANLQQANLQQANLQGAYLADADLRRATLINSDLRQSMLSGAEAPAAQFDAADLRRAILKRANLRGSRLVDADLRQADLKGVDLSNALLVNTRLDRANLTAARLARTVFEPYLGSLPPVTHFDLVSGLTTLSFVTSPYALVELRDAFKQAGLRQPERALTFAINRGLRRQASPVEGAFSLVFFDLTCQYGMAPGRPWLLLGMLIAGCAVPYTLVCRSRDHRAVGSTERWWQVVRRWIRLALMGLVWSCTAALPIGRRPGLWPGQLDMLPKTGWIRWLAGLQAFCSLYLLALWCLIAFAAPFE